MTQQDTQASQNSESIDTLSSELVDEVSSDEILSPEVASNSEQEGQAALLRLKADYDNLVKRHAREQAEMKNFFTSNIVAKLLPAYDNIARIALQSSVDTPSETLLSGIRSAKDIFEKNLSSLGVTKFESIGQEVDPARHDVMSQGPGPEGKIIADFESGFAMGDNIVRHAKVVVGSGE